MARRIHPFDLHVAEQVVKSASRIGSADRTHAGHTGHEEDRAADQADQGQDKARRPDAAVEARLLCVAGQDQSDNAQNDGDQRGLAEEPQNDRDDAKHKAGGSSAFAGDVVVFFHYYASFLFFCK